MRQRIGNVHPYLKKLSRTYQGRHKLYLGWHPICMILQPEKRGYGADATKTA